MDVSLVWEKDQEQSVNIVCTTNAVSVCPSIPLSQGHRTRQQQSHAAAGNSGIHTGWAVTPELFFRVQML